MRWLRKAQKPKKKKVETEVAKNRATRQKAVQGAIKESRNAVRIIGENGFTVGIFVAAGGKTKKRSHHAH